MLPKLSYPCAVRKADIFVEATIPIAIGNVSPANPGLKVNPKNFGILYKINKKENERQIQSFLAERPDYSLVSQRTIFTFEFDSDGFFVAKLWRNGL